MAFCRWILRLKSQRKNTEKLSPLFEHFGSNEMLELLFPRMLCILFLFADYHPVSTHDPRGFLFSCVVLSNFMFLLCFFVFVTL